MMEQTDAPKKTMIFEAKAKFYMSEDKKQWHIRQKVTADEVSKIKEGNKNFQADFWCLSCKSLVTHNKKNANGTKACFVHKLAKKSCNGVASDHP